MIAGMEMRQLFREEMMITPPELLNTSIAQLQTLVAFLEDQLSWIDSAARETRACRELARSLCSLIRAHEAPPWAPRVSVPNAEAGQDAAEIRRVVTRPALQGFFCQMSLIEQPVSGGPLRAR